MELVNDSQKGIVPLHLVSEQDAVNIDNFVLTQERVRSLQKDKLLLVAKLLEILTESANMVHWLMLFPLICLGQTFFNLLMNP